MKRGTTLIELLVAMGLMLVIMSIGYTAYSTLMRADDVEARREQLHLTAQALMGRIKEDVRSAGSITASGNRLSITRGDDRIVYTSLRGGSAVERRTRSARRLYKDVNAGFSPSGKGVSVSVNGKSEVHRRAIRVELSSFISPRH